MNIVKGIQVVSCFLQPVTEIWNSIASAGYYPALSTEHPLLSQEVYLVK